MTTETTPSESTRNATITKTPGRDPAGVLAARVLARASMSENTRRVYATALRAFEGSGVSGDRRRGGGVPGRVLRGGPLGGLRLFGGSSSTLLRQAAGAGLFRRVHRPLCPQAENSCKTSSLNLRLDISAPSWRCAREAECARGFPVKLQRKTRASGEQRVRPCNHPAADAHSRNASP